MAEHITSSDFTIFARFVLSLTVGHTHCIETIKRNTIHHQDSAILLLRFFFFYIKMKVPSTFMIKFGLRFWFGLVTSGVVSQQEQY